MSESCKRYPAKLAPLFKLRDWAMGAIKAATAASWKRDDSRERLIEPALGSGLILTKVDLAFALLSLVTLACSLALLGPLKIRVESGPLFFKCLMGVFLLALMILYVRRAPRIAQIARVAFWAIVFTNVFILPLYLGNRLDIPFQDDTLAFFDRCLGVEIPGIIRDLNGFPALLPILNCVYESLVFLIALALILPAALGQTDKSDEFLMAIALGALVTIPFLYFIPAVGPWVHYKELCANDVQANCYKVFQALKSGNLVICNLGRVDPLVTFPSWHTMFAVLSAVSLTRIRVVRWLAAIWAAAVLVSCVTSGWHYVVDVLGGLVLALVTARVSFGLIRWMTDYPRPPLKSVRRGRGPASRSSALRRPEGKKKTSPENRKPDPARPGWLQRRRA
jgi:membrane-associated phospholipid phosphatase